MVSGDNMDINELVMLSVKHNASDLHLCPGQLPIVRIDGALRALEDQRPVEAEWIEQCCAEYLDARGRAALELGGQADCAMTFTHGQRARGHFFRQRTGTSSAVRLIPPRCPTLDSLAVPSADR